MFDNTTRHSISRRQSTLHTFHSRPIEWVTLQLTSVPQAVQKNFIGVFFTVQIQVAERSPRQQLSNNVESCLHPLPRSGGLLPIPPAF